MNLADMSGPLVTETVLPRKSPTVGNGIPARGVNRQKLGMAHQNPLNAQKSV